jgi:hypothetical protein
MPLQLGALRDALLSAGAPPDKADKAAEEMAGYESRFSKVEADLYVVKWMLAVLITGVGALVIKAFA